MTARHPHATTTGVAILIIFIASNEVATQVRYSECWWVAGQCHQPLNVIYFLFARGRHSTLVADRDMRPG